MNTCPFCKGEIEAVSIEHVHRWHGVFFLIRDVPVERCVRCREVFLSPGTLREIDARTTSAGDRGESVSMRVVTLGDRAA